MKFLLLLLLFTSSIFSFGDKDNAQFVIPISSDGGENSIDTFGRDRVGQPFQTGGYFFTYDLKPFDFGQSTSGSGIVTHDSVSGVAVVSSGAGVGSARFRSNQYHLYQPEKSQEIDLSLTPGTAKTGFVKKWGYYDDDDGLYFKLESDNNLQVCLLTSTSGSAVETCVSQDSFNSTNYEAKKFLSNDFDITKATIYKINFQWLGSGIVRFYIADENGGFINVHNFKNPFKKTVPYMKRGALPIQFEVTSTAEATENDYMNVICCSVVSNGGEEPAQQTFASFLPNIGTTSGTNETHTISFRLKDTFKGQVNTTTVFPQSLDLIADGGTVRFRVYQNCTITGASWVDVGNGASPGGFLASSDVGSSAEVTQSGTISNCEKIVEARTIFGSTKAGTTIGGEGSVGFQLFKVVKKAFDGGGVFTITTQQVGVDPADYDISLRWGESR